MSIRIFVLIICVIIISACSSKTIINKKDINIEKTSDTKNKVLSDYVQKTYALFFNEYGNFTQLKWNIKEGIDNKKICDDLEQCFIDSNYLFENIAFTMDGSILFLNKNNSWQFNTPKEIKKYNFKKVKKYINNILCYKTEIILNKLAVDYSWENNKIKFTDYLISEKNFFVANKDLVENCAFLTKSNITKKLYYENRFSFYI